MANLIYKRVSTDRQSTDRQNLLLEEARIDDPLVFEEEAGTSSRLHPLRRPNFGELLTYARPGDTVHISEMFRLVRGTGHILDVLDVLHAGRLAREYDVSRGAIRTAVADLLPEYTAADRTPWLRNCRSSSTCRARLQTSSARPNWPPERAALDQGVTVRRGQGYTLRVTAIPSVHRQFLVRCQPLDGGHGLPAIPAQWKARREYENRVGALTPGP
ncbi:recombinase family protein [Streptosporangium canum]|uniref:recombinase family protein n=1 Tax=Streptosporangium canum TaxID=324952 RepID=UPI0036A00348